MHNFKNLAVWKKSRILVKEVYILVSNFPIDEKYGLSSQIKRSAISIPSNIAEGTGRSTNQEFIRFLKISLGSSYELETQILLAIDLEIIRNINYDNIINQICEIQRMICGLIRTLEK